MKTSEFAARKSGIGLATVGKSSPAVRRPSRHAGGSSLRTWGYLAAGLVAFLITLHFLRYSARMSRHHTPSYRVQQAGSFKGTDGHAHILPGEDPSRHPQVVSAHTAAINQRVGINHDAHLLSASPNPQDPAEQAADARYHLIPPGERRPDVDLADLDGDLDGDEDGDAVPDEDAIGSREAADAGVHSTAYVPYVGAAHTSFRAGMSDDLSGEDDSQGAAESGGGATVRLDDALTGDNAADVDDAGDAHADDDEDDANSKDDGAVMRNDSDTNIEDTTDPVTDDEEVFDGYLFDGYDGGADDDDRDGDGGLGGATGDLEPELANVEDVPATDEPAVGAGDTVRGAGVADDAAEEAPPLADGRHQPADLTGGGLKGGTQLDDGETPEHASVTDTASAAAAAAAAALFPSDAEAAAEAAAATVAAARAAAGGTGSVIEAALSGAAALGDAVPSALAPDASPSGSPAPGSTSAVPAPGTAVTETTGAAGTVGVSRAAGAGVVAAGAAAGARGAVTDAGVAGVVNSVLTQQRRVHARGEAYQEQFGVMTVVPGPVQPPPGGEQAKPPGACRAVGNAEVQDGMFEWVQPIVRPHHRPDPSLDGCCAACQADAHCRVWRHCPYTSGCGPYSKLGTCHLGHPVEGYTPDPFKILKSINPGVLWTTGMELGAWEAGKVRELVAESKHITPSATLTAVVLARRRQDLLDAVATPLVYLDVSAHGEPLGRMVFALNLEKARKAAENFRALCTGEAGIAAEGHPGEGLPYHLKETMFYRILPGYLMQGGTGTDAAGGGQFGADRMVMHTKHERAGMLSMVSSGARLYDSHFVITLGEAAPLDQHAVNFGEIVSGWGVLRVVNELATAAASVTGTGYSDVSDDLELVVDDSGQLR